MRRSLLQGTALLYGSGQHPHRSDAGQHAPGRCHAGGFRQMGIQRPAQGMLGGMLVPIRRQGGFPKPAHAGQAGLHQDSIFCKDRADKIPCTGGILRTECKAHCREKQLDRGFGFIFKVVTDEKNSHIRYNPADTGCAPFRNPGWRRRCVPDRSADPRSDR